MSAKALNQIHNSDIKDLIQSLDDESVDLIITDPPYLKEYLYTYDYLADLCPRVMKHGASLLTIVGHFALEKVFASFQNKLKYRWILCLNQFDGSHARMAMGIEVTWKPMLWYVKDAYPQGRGFIKDGIKIEGKDGQNKTRHKWEQDGDTCRFWIEKLTKPGDVVFDPYCGSGTFIYEAAKLGRNFIGFDVDAESCKTARSRLLELNQEP